VKYPFSRQDSYLEAAPQAPPLEERLPDPNTEPKQQWPTSPRRLSRFLSLQNLGGFFLECRARRHKQVEERLGVRD